MQAVIMAGGKGTRLTEITKDELPKPMVPLCGKPLLLWQVEKLKENGIKDFIMVIGHLGEKIRDYFDDGKKFGVSIRYVEEQEPLGTAGSFYYLKPLITESYFLLVFGDVYFDISVSRMEKFHCEKQAKASLFVHPNSHPFDSDLVELDRNARVVRFDSKLNVRKGWYDNCVNAGFYILNRDLLETVREPVKADLEKDILMKLAENGESIFGYRSPEYIKDIGTVERIRQTEEDMQKNFIAKKCLDHKQPCIFLDRDGTINEYHGLLYREEEFVLEKRAAEAIGLINRSGMLGIVITNQPSVARGLCSIEDIERIHRKMSALLGQKGVYLDDVLFCPHHPDKGYPEENPIYKIKCNCRKPGIGMLEEAVKRYNIDLEHSWIIGDTTLDMQTGWNAGIHTALVRTGEAGKDGKYQIEPDLICDDIYDAVKQIMEKA